MVVFAVEVGGTLVEGLADDFEVVGTIGVEGLAVWRDVEAWLECNAGFSETVEDTKTKVTIILKTFYLS